MPYYAIYNVNTGYTFIECNYNQNVSDGEYYESNLIQKYNGKVYYCSSDGSPENMNLPRLDFSNTDLEYKKLPVNTEGGVQSFIIYGGNIYYISDYIIHSNANGIYSAGNLYKCDMNGNNKILISNNVSNLRFSIGNNELHYNTYDNEAYYKTYDINTGEITIEKDYVYPKRDKWLFEFEDSSGQCMTFDGGYYYYSYNNGKTETINGELANIYYYRKDIKSGETIRVGYSYSQVG